jgi:hypothetical protein
VIGGLWRVVAVRPGDGYRPRIREGVPQLVAVDLARRWSKEWGSAYVMSGTQMWVFRDGVEVASATASMEMFPLPMLRARPRLKLASERVGERRCA